MAKYKGFQGMDEYLDALDTCMKKAPGRCIDELAREGRQVVRTYRNYVSTYATTSKTGNLKKGMKFNKREITKEDGTYKAYIKNDERKAPHFHLVEYGHELRSHKPERAYIKDVKGRYYLKKSIGKEEPKLQAKRERMIEKLFRELE